MARAIAVVEQMLAPRIIGGECREREFACLVKRLESCRTGGCLFGDALEAPIQIGAVQSDAHGELGPIIDDVFRLKISGSEEFCLPAFVIAARIGDHTNALVTQCRDH